VVFDESTDVVKLCWRIMKFYAHESCGQCTPCREGTGWLARICKRVAEGEGRPGDVELMANVAVGIAGNTICALGEAAAWPMLGFLTKFRADFESQGRVSKGGLTGEQAERLEKPHRRDGGLRILAGGTIGGACSPSPGATR
jgi:NADH-quinone oxidoreductase subunit F